VVKTGSKSPLIVRVPGIHGGEPVIKGTRVPVRTIVLSLEDYDGDQRRLAEDFELDLAAVEAALAYYASHKDEIERIIDKHERAAFEV
jgi:uncharacterized protein (DUF433 family)